MTRRTTSALFGSLIALAAATAGLDAETFFADRVISYNPGTAPSPGYTNPSAALGSPERYTGEGAWPGIVSPFNPPWLTDEVVSIGEAGQITLRLARYVLPQAGEPEIGIFTNSGIVDPAWPGQTAGTPAVILGGADEAVVEVSEDGIAWVALDPAPLDIPTNGYTNPAAGAPDVTDAYQGAPGSTPSDFGKPFTQPLSSFDGVKFYDAGAPDMLDLLAGSGGGTWLDISPTSLVRVGYVRLSRPDDGDAQTALNFDLDAVAIANGAVGEPVPEPSSLLLAALGVALVCGGLRRL